MGRFSALIILKATPYVQMAAAIAELGQAKRAQREREVGGLETNGVLIGLQATIP